MRRSPDFPPRRVSTPACSPAWCSGSSAVRSTPSSPSPRRCRCSSARRSRSSARGDPARHAALAACVALIVAAIALIAWLVRAGNAIGFFSETVLVGFKCGLAFYLASTQLPKLFGFKGTHGDFWERVGVLLEPPRRHTRGIVAHGRRRSPWRCSSPASSGSRTGRSPFSWSSAGILAARALEPRGARRRRCSARSRRACRRSGCQRVTRADLNALLPLALACFVLAAVETSAIGRMFGAETRLSL